MTHRGPQCVFVAPTVGEAEVVANWLEHEGIEAGVMDRTTLGGFEGLNFFSSTHGPSRGVEVWVLDGLHLDRARQLLAEHQAEKQGEASSRSSDEAIEAQCEECGKATAFPGDLAGRIGTCPACQAYMDIPGGAEDDD